MSEGGGKASDAKDKCLLASCLIIRNSD